MGIGKYNDPEISVLGDCAVEMSKLDDIDARRRVIDYLVARFIPEEEPLVMGGPLFYPILEPIRSETFTKRQVDPTPSTPPTPPDDLEVNP